MDECILITNDEAKSLKQFLEFYLKNEMKDSEVIDPAIDDDSFFDDYVNLFSILKKCKTVIKNG